MVVFIFIDFDLFIGVKLINYLSNSLKRAGCRLLPALLPVPKAGRRRLARRPANGGRPPLPYSRGDVGKVKSFSMSYKFKKACFEFCGFYLWVFKNVGFCAILSRN